MEEEYEEIKIERTIVKKNSSNEGSNLSWWIVTPLLIGLFSAMAYLIGAGTFVNNSAIQNEHQALKLNHIIDIIENNYVDSVDRDLLVESSIKEMLHKLDPHSSYIPAKDVEQENEQLQGHFGGVGIRFIILRDTLMVTNVIEGGPSEKAGLLPGDRIIQVDDEKIAGNKIEIDDVFGLLKGEFGSQVELTVYRPKTDLKETINVTRGIIPLPSVDVAVMLDESTGYIRITNFSNQTGNEFSKALKKLKASGMKGVVVDLRSNGGGYLHAATSVADEFLKDEKLVVYTEGLHQPRKDYYATDYGGFEEGKVAILINSATASASEIVSGAIQDNDRGLIIGRRSFGKGWVQQPMPTEDGSELRLTVSRYYTPTGRCIQKPYGDGIDYQNDIYDRYENGELQHIDSTIFENAEKFTTPKGRVVYGGGGIMPDVFVPIDTNQSSLYYTALMYSTIFRDFCFDYLDKNRANLQFDNVDEYNLRFQISDLVLDDFVRFASTKGVSKDADGLAKAKEKIKTQIKAEIAGYLWGEQERFVITMKDDNDINTAVKNIKN